jgi:hypothetical protein
MSRVGELVEELADRSGEASVVRREPMTLRLDVCSLWWLDVLAERSGKARARFASDLLERAVSDLCEQAEEAGILTSADHERFTASFVGDACGLSEV